MNTDLGVLEFRPVPRRSPRQCDEYLFLKVKTPEGTEVELQCTLQELGRAYFRRYDCSSSGTPEIGVSDPLLSRLRRS